MNDDLKKTLLATKAQAMYDAAAKKLLSHKIILAHILVYTVDEFKDMEPNEVVKLIEGTPQVSKTYVENGMTNQEQELTDDDTTEYISGINSEDTETNEGYIRYDIIFYVLTKDGKTRIIINVEAQKNEPTKYSILNRAIFYVCRMISSQKEREFTNTSYDDIKKVYSIWICMNQNEATLDHIHLVNDRKLGKSNWKGSIDLPNIVMIGLSKDIVKAEEHQELHRMLGILLSQRMTPDEKLDTMSSEYNITFDANARKDVNDMCNLGEGIYEEGIEEGIKKNISKTILILKDIGIEDEKIITQIAMKFNIPSDEAREYLEKVQKQTV